MLLQRTPAQQQRHQRGHIAGAEEAWPDQHADVAVIDNRAKQPPKLGVGNFKMPSPQGANGPPQSGDRQPVGVAATGETLARLFEPFSRPHVVCGHRCAAKGQQNEGGGPLVTGSRRDLQTLAGVRLGAGQIARVAVEQREAQIALGAGARHPDGLDNAHRGGITLEHRRHVVRGHELVGVAEPQFGNRLG